MKKIFFVILTLILFSCNDTKLSKNSETSYDDLRAYIGKNFKNVSEEEKFYSMIGASAGGAFKNSDFYVEAYKFSSTDKAKDAAKDLGKLMSGCFNSGYFVMCPTEKSSKDAKNILKKF